MTDKQNWAEELLKEADSTTKEGDQFLCTICHQLINVVRPGNGTLVCCDTPMKKVS